MRTRCERRIQADSAKCGVIPVRLESAVMRLDSWKEISQYLQRDESTVQRWEKREGMPVHRHVHEKRGSVYAFTEELDAWSEGRRQRQEQPATSSDVTVAVAEPGARRRAWLIGGAVAAAALLLSVSLVARRWVTERSPATSEAVPSLVRLTSTSGLNIDPALSPDGSLVAYSSDRPDSADLDIWLQPIRGGAPTRITTQPGDELEPSFSPDGTVIAFAKGNTGGIYTVGAVGGEPRLLVEADRAHSPRFSPDGRLVTYWTGLPPWTVSPGVAGSLFVVNASGGEPRAVAPLFAHARFGTWSPDGRKLLFLGQPGGARDESSIDWYVVGVEGGEPVATGAVSVLRQAGVTGLPIPSAWSRDGAVLFANYEQPASNVWKLQVDVEGGRVTGTPRRLTFGTALERSPAINAAGRVVFTSIVENVDVWRLPLDDRTGAAKGAPERVTDNPATDRVENVTPDGHTLAFLSSRTGRDEVWLRDLRTNQDRQATFAGAHTARLSPDGHVVALERDTALDTGTHLVSVAGGATSPLCDDCEPYDWSPDGQTLLITRGMPSRLCVIDVASRRAREIAAHPSWSLFRGRFSPDGRWVAFHAAKSPTEREVFVVPTDTSDPVPPAQWISLVTDFGVQPSWAPDGSAVYYFSLRDGAFCAWLQPVNPVTKQPSGPPHAVQHFHNPRLRPAASAMATNAVAGGYLYVTLTESAANIWMLDR